jgi:hypothetical protein
MWGLSQIRITWKLRILIAMTILAMGVFAWVSFSTLLTVEVNGPLFEKIYAEQDLAGDIEPPMSSLLPMRLTVYLALDEPDAEKRSQLIDRMLQERKEFDSMY